MSSDKGLILVLGGARSGKSTHAEALATRLAGDTGRVLYLATAQASDEEMARRIARHRRDRPSGWQTIEEPLDLGSAIAGWSPPSPTPEPGRREGGGAGRPVVLVDCVTIWLSNLLIGPEHDPERLPDEDQATATARAAVEALLAAYARGAAGMILVSNEVGMGLVPPYPLGRLYRDTLGRVNAWLAAAADEVYLLVAGLPLRIKPDGGLRPRAGEG